MYSEPCETPAPSALGRRRARAPRGGDEAVRWPPRRAALAACIALGLGANGCDGATETDAPAEGVRVHVAALELPEVDRVCYELAVYNGDPRPATGDGASLWRPPETVWREERVCSDRYGIEADGSVAFIGPCDATVAGHNFVELVLTAVYAGGASMPLTDQVTADGGDADFENPCTAASPCYLDFRCIENEGVLVRFDLTIMRDANLGFFELAVRFDDIFCSAKLDTCYDGDVPIDLLLGGDGERDWTAVAAVACSAGSDAIQTELLLQEPRVACDGDVAFTLPLDGVEIGEHTVEVEVAGTPIALTYGVFFGGQRPLGGGRPMNDLYYNLALDLDDLAATGLADCRFSFGATAQDRGRPVFDDHGAFVDPNGVYPGIRFGPSDSGPSGIPLTGADAAPLCSANPLNGAGSLVQTTYLRGAAIGGPGGGATVAYRSVGAAATMFPPAP